MTWIYILVPRTHLPRSGKGDAGALADLPEAV